MRLLSRKNRLNRRKFSAQGGQKPAPRYYFRSSGPAAASPFQRRPAATKPRSGILKRIKNAVVAIVLVAGLVYSLIIKPRPEVLVADTSYHPASVYQSAAQATLMPLRNRNKLTLDKNAISSAMKRQFPEISFVELKLPLLRQIPTFKIDIAAPTFNLSSANNLYIVGANGVVVAASGQLPNLSKLPTVIDQSGFEASPGKQVLSTEAIAFINTILVQCQRAGVNVQSLTLPAAPQALELRASGSPYFVKFDLGGDATLQAGQYLAAKHQFDSENTQPSQYLDVRVAGKIYYK
ncbi:hypothetical protein HYS84_00770 [Candidatus Saccharibacteria bacterium]|nr:hypothetical protein [Candidatus Saccharibacteria bacterium]